MRKIREHRTCPVCRLKRVRGRPASKVIGPGWGGTVYDCPVDRGGCGWRSHRRIHGGGPFLAGHAVTVLRAAPFPAVRDALVAAEAGLREKGADLTVYRQPLRRVCLGQHGIGAGRVAALRRVSTTAARITTGMQGANAYRYYFPISVVIRAARIVMNGGAK